MMQEQIKKVGHGVRVLAPAKINLSLLVAGKRPDGFHELETIMAKIDFYDELLIEAGRKAGIELICQGPEWAPAGQENLVYKAAKLLLERNGRSADLRITLTKNIPASSGLGGASSDAAATLIGLNEYLGANLGEQELKKLAVEQGSDVAFFLDGRLAFCTGKGEKIRKLRQKFDFRAVLLLPDISVSTEKVYANYRHDEDEFERLSGQISELVRKNRIDLAVNMCANMLSASSFELYPELAKLKAQVESLGVRPVCLSGSGSAMYYIVDIADGGRVEQFQRIVKEQTGCKSIIISNNRW